MVDAALRELVENGYENLTMNAIAARAGASKETLYRWFGSREGLFTTVIEANGDASAARVAGALDSAADPVDVLTRYARGLLALLTGEQSVALNRAAMSSPPLAGILLASGRHRIGPLVEQYLGLLADDGFLDIEDPADAFRLLYGLVVQDIQIRVLLGEPPPAHAELDRHAGVAVERFLRLTGPDPDRRRPGTV